MASKENLVFKHSKGDHLDSFIDLDTEVTKQESGEKSLQARAVDALEELQTCCEQLGIPVSEFLEKHESGEFEASESGDEKTSEVDEPQDANARKKSLISETLKKKRASAGA